MDIFQSTTPPRMLASAELGAVIKGWRERRHWSQEQLAEIAKVNTRTIQRVERGEGASADTRRALAVAFEVADIDLLNKPLPIPTPEDLAAAQAQLARDYLLLPATPLRSGKTLASLVEASQMDQSALAFDAPEAAEKAFAQLVDLFRDYRDIDDLCSEAEKVDLWREFQEHLDELHSLGVTICWATQTVPVRLGGQGEAVPVAALYLQGFPIGLAPNQLAAPRKSRIGF
jgi:transcriptional regulator with XRE-family HTH domain